MEVTVLTTITISYNNSNTHRGTASAEDELLLLPFEEQNTLVWVARHGFLARYSHSQCWLSCTWVNSGLLSNNSNNNNWNNQNTDNCSDDNKKIIMLVMMKYQYHYNYITVQIITVVIRFCIIIIIFIIFQWQNQCHNALALYSNTKSNYGIDENGFLELTPFMINFTK